MTKRPCGLTERQPELCATCPRNQSCFDRKGPPAPDHTKYHSKKTIYDGIMYDSILEASVAQELRMLHIPFEAKPKDQIIRVRGKNGREYLYKPDFKIFVNGEWMLLEAKGFPTADGYGKLAAYNYRIKRQDPPGLLPLLVATKPGSTTWEPLDQWLQGQIRKGRTRWKS